MTLQEAQQKANIIHSIYLGALYQLTFNQLYIEEMEAIIEIDKEFSVKIIGKKFIIEQYYAPDDTEPEYKEFKHYDIMTLKEI